MTSRNALTNPILTSYQQKTFNECLLPKQASPEGIIAEVPSQN